MWYLIPSATALRLVESIPELGYRMFYSVSPVVREELALRADRGLRLPKPVTRPQSSCRTHAGTAAEDVSGGNSRAAGTRILLGLQFRHQLVYSRYVVIRRKIRVTGKGFALFAVYQNLDFRNSWNVGRNRVNQ